VEALTAEVNVNASSITAMHVDTDDRNYICEISRNNERSNVSFAVIKSKIQHALWTTRGAIKQDTLPPSAR